MGCRYCNRDALRSRYGGALPSSVDSAAAVDRRVRPAAAHRAAAPGHRHDRSGECRRGPPGRSLRVQLRRESTWHRGGVALAEPGRGQALLRSATRSGTRRRGGPGRVCLRRAGHRRADPLGGATADAGPVPQQRVVRLQDDEARLVERYRRDGRLRHRRVPEVRLRRGGHRAGGDQRRAGERGRRDVPPQRRTCWHARAVRPRGWDRPTPQSHRGASQHGRGRMHGRLGRRVQAGRLEGLHPGSDGRRLLPPGTWDRMASRRQRIGDAAPRGGESDGRQGRLRPQGTERHGRRRRARRCRTGRPGLSRHRLPHLPLWL